MKLFPVSVISVGHLAGHVSIVAARYVCSTVAAVSIAITSNTSLLKVY